MKLNRIANCSKVAIEKNVQLHNRLAPNLPQVMADIGQVQQILMNLIINGAESLEGEAGEISITTKRVYLDLDDLSAPDLILPPPTPGPFVAISVRDNGGGMDEATLAKIFDPFFTTKFTGRGLGLAAVLGIVRSHNGGLSVVSIKGEGTLFDVYFPVAAKQDSPAPIYPKQRETDPVTFQPKESRSNQLILLIDDDYFVQDAIKDIFEMEKMGVVWAPNGREGIAKLQLHQDRVRLVLLDLSMPGISAEETFLELRRFSPSLPILLCSGFSEFKISNRFSEIDHAGFVAKPFDIHKLVKTVQNLIDQNE